ncbi:MAG: RHS repeat-associated core domain-containing protein [Fimbriimonadales bacterium]
MFSTTSTASKSVAVLCSFLMVNLAVPMGLPKLVVDNWPEFVRSKPKVKAPQTRPLSAHEMRQMQGRFVKNPYIAGANKWSVSYNGVDLLTGNFSLSATDMTFEGGYGIPVNVTRSYSSNNADEGPIGYGWSLSVDVRSTAGGILKSSSAPIRSVPVNFKERPSAQTNDPNAEMVNGSAVQPPSAVVATDASGKEETEQRDVDGIITTPPWDKNTNDATYEYVTLSGNTYQVLTHNVTTTPDGTVYVYDKEGTYQTYDSYGNVNGGGEVSNDGAGSSEPSNVLKITSATDRQGNVTTYSYGSGAVTFSKVNGTAYEHPLTSISMPNGHQINFHWGTGSTGDYPGPTNRIMKIDDNITSGGRTVTYGYSSGDLVSVTTPAGLTTYYGYGSATGFSGGYFYGDTADDLLTTITDPRGLETTIGYFIDASEIAPYMVSMEAARAYKVIAPNGVRTYFYGSGSTNWPTDSYFYGNPPPATVIGYVDLLPGASTPFQQTYYSAFEHTGEPVFETGMAGIGGYGGDSGDPTYASESTWRRMYDSRTQDLLEETHYDSPIYNTLTVNRVMEVTGPFTVVDAATSCNFMGNKLSETVTEGTRSGSSGSYTNTRVHTTDYAYWGADKYFQQRGTRIQTGSSTYRYTMTDYFDSSAAAGAKGQTKAVYSPAFSGFSITQGGQPTMPSGGEPWKYYIQPTDSTTPAAKFYDSSGNPAYDSVGRCTDVWKLQSTTTSPWTYVQTHTTHGSNGSPHWGQAYQVVEDYGGIGRTTTTNDYTSWGTANDVTDAAGHEFVTDYDADGKVNSVTRTDGTSQTIVSYSYGSSGVTNGQPTQVTDGLSGVVQTIGYNDGSSSTFGNSNYIGGVGQVKSVSEDDPGSLNYGASYTYTAVGDRSTALYSKNSSETARWGYTDYVPAGDPARPSRIFQTLVKLDTSNNPTSEEFHYAYDGSGRLLVASFAQTPQAGFTPSTGNPWYDSTHVAATRARAYYVYDPGGRMTQLNYWWDTSTSGTAYGTPEAILSNTCSYEVSTGTSNYNRGLKAVSDFYHQNSSDHTAFTLDHEEQYGYDNNLDYLTSSSYDGGSTSTTWSYDAAGNRNDATVVDNLNRATTISGTSRSYDVLGDTTAIGSTKTMSWDVTGRMSSYTLSSATTNYAYRSDGMRVSKVAGTQTVSYGYDTQMPVEECLIDSGNSSNNYTTRYGLGARSIDRIETVTSGTAVSYPIYDSHGNMLTTLSKSGGGYTYATCRLYDVWGGIRSGSTSGSPSGRHCANLGHVQDDESELVYMRARYYEPGTGRFLTEDPGMQGWNYFSYCSSDPINQVDRTGKEGVGAKELWEVLVKLCKQFGWDANVLVKTAKVAVLLYGLMLLAEKCLLGIESGWNSVLYGEFLLSLSLGGMTSGFGASFIAGGAARIIINGATLALAIYFTGLEIASIEAGGEGDG